MSPDIHAPPIRAPPVPARPPSACLIACAPKGSSVAVLPSQRRRETLEAKTAEIAAWNLRAKINTRTQSHRPQRVIGLTARVIADANRPTVDGEIVDTGRPDLAARYR